MNGVRWLRTSEGGFVLAAEGLGPALLCIHGLSANRHSWDAVGRSLRDRFTVVAPDLLGRGDSELPAQPRYRLADEVRRVAELVQLTEMESLIVVGHSHGAAIALGLARQLPAVTGLVLVSPTTPWSKRPRALDMPGLRQQRAVAAIMKRFRKPITRYILERRVLGADVNADQELIDRYSAAYAEEERALALLAALVDWRPEELTDWLPDRSVPTIVMSGVLDHRMPVRETVRLADRIGASYVAVARAGHAVPDERPNLVAEAVREIGESMKLPSYTMPDGGPTSA
jgi:magnesium chelatase accessory protein